MLQYKLLNSKAVDILTCVQYNKVMNNSERYVKYNQELVKKSCHREARKTTILQPVDQKPQLQKDRQDEKAEGYAPDEGTRENPRKTTK